MKPPKKGYPLGFANGFSRGSGTHSAQLRVPP